MSALDELTAPLGEDYDGNQKLLTYDATHPYLKELVQHWAECKGVQITYIQSTCADKKMYCTADVEKWTAGNRVVVWDLYYDNHANVAIFIPSTGLHVLDPVPGGIDRARSFMVAIGSQNRGPAPASCTAHDLPEDKETVGISADPNGVCMLWCCFFVNVMMLGLDWDQAVRAENVDCGLERSKEVPATIYRALISIPNFILDNRHCINLTWAKGRDPIVPGHYEELYGAGITDRWAYTTKRPGMGAAFFRQQFGDNFFIYGTFSKMGVLRGAFVDRRCYIWRNGCPTTPS